jgi:hypothetical protein
VRRLPCLHDKKKSASLKLLMCFSTVASGTGNQGTGNCSGLRRINLGLGQAGGLVGFAAV